MWKKHSKNNHCKAVPSGHVGVLGSCMDVWGYIRFVLDVYIYIYISYTRFYKEIWGSMEFYRGIWSLYRDFPGQKFIEGCLMGYLHIRGI